MTFDYSSRITPENITELKPNEIFVYGANEAGRHGLGAAKIALKFGAKYGEIGFNGQSYGIPTKDRNLKVLPLEDIQDYITTFILWAEDEQIEDTGNIFLVTQIGCGYSHYTSNDIAPLFVNAITLSNIYLPLSFWEILKTNYSDPNYRYQDIDCCAKCTNVKIPSYPNDWKCNKYGMIVDGNKGICNDFSKVVL
jgi:hypothetical protein